MPPSILKNILAISGSLIICFGASWFGSLVTIPEIDNWYAELRKPFFNPPYYVFSPVWIVLYILMSFALYRLMMSGHPDKGKAITLFLIQLALNILWSFLFFKWHLLTLAAIEMLVLLAAIVLFMITARPVSKVATYCFIPYVIWVSFASVLTICISFLN